MLATGAGVVEPHAAERRYALAIACGAAGAGALMLALLKLRPDLAEAVMLPMFWLKIGFVASLLAVLRLSRPGARLDGVAGAIAAPLLVMGAIAVMH